MILVTGFSLDKSSIDASEKKSQKIGVQNTTLTNRNDIPNINRTELGVDDKHCRTNREYLVGTLGCISPRFSILTCKFQDMI